MVALYIILSIIGVAFFVCSGIVCGRICATIIRDKNPEMNEVLWFWYGFLCQWIAVFSTCVIKPKNR